MIPIKADKIKLGSYIAAYVCDANCGGEYSLSRALDIFKTGRRGEVYGEALRVVPGFKVEYFGTRWDKRGAKFIKDDNVHEEFSHPSDWMYVDGEDIVALFLLTEEEYIEHVVKESI